MDRPFLLAVMGATATGKTEVAEALADSHNAILINADAFQVYRGMDIGTAKPENRERYHLLDLKDPDDSFGVGEWVALALPILQKAFDEGRNAIVVGGTGLYIRALFEDYAEMAPPPDATLRKLLEERQSKEGLAALAKELSTRAPETAARTDLKNPARVRRALEKLDSPAETMTVQLPPFRQLKAGLELGNDELQYRILARIERMVHNGWVQELEMLRDAGYQPEHPGFRAIGYRSMWNAMVGETDLDEAIATTIAETRRYAKRQRTWLRSEPRLAMVGAEDAIRQIEAHLKTEV